MQETEARWLVEQTAKTPRVLELGWGSGIVARALADVGRNVCVVEGAEESCNAAERLGIRADRSMFETYEPLREFDCVIASFVLEHVADPVALLKRMTAWAPKLIAVVGNAESWHRRLAVKMGLQPALDTLSPRDHAVGHYRVYSLQSIEDALRDAGWQWTHQRGIMLKPLPNAMMQHFDERLIRAMCEVEVAPWEAANIGLCCERV